MKKFKEISEVKKGDKFKMEHGYSVWTAKCIFNNTETKTIGYSLRCIFGLIPFGISGSKKYSDYNFENFSSLND